jgi:TRAP-type C4-dicarboxylate transport system permease small subunit
MNAPPHPIIWRSSIERAIYKAVECVAGILVLVEVFVLLIGVVARFAFHRPLVWSDELATVLFLWLAMLGSAVVLQRGEHMGLTAITKPANCDRW